MATCVDCSHLIAKATAWPHHALGRLYAPSGAGTAVFSCTVCQTTFLQDVELIRAEDAGTEHRVFGDLRCATAAEAERIRSKGGGAKLAAPRR